MRALINHLEAILAASSPPPYHTTHRLPTSPVRTPMLSNLPLSYTRYRQSLKANKELLLRIFRCQGGEGLTTEGENK